MFFINYGIIHIEALELLPTVVKYFIKGLSCFPIFKKRKWVDIIKSAFEKSDVFETDQNVAVWLKIPEITGTTATQNQEPL